MRSARLVPRPYGYEAGQISVTLSGAADHGTVMHSEHDSQGPGSSWLMRSAAGEVVGFARRSEQASSDVENQALIRELARALHELLPP